MVEYIEREALMQSLRNNVLVDVTPHIEDAIEEVPAADVAPVVHGEWIGKYEGLYSCSNCHCFSELRIHSYCPCCGAKMDGGKG